MTAAMVDGGDADKLSLLPTDSELVDEMCGKYHMSRWKKDLSYRVEVYCPNCRQEHNYQIVRLDEDEQETVEKFYEANSNRSSLRMALEGMIPLKVKRKFLCPYCGTEFEAVVPISRESYLGRKTGAMRDDRLIQAW